MVSYPVFMALFSLATAVGLVAGVYAFGDPRRLTRERILAGVGNNWKYAIVLALILLAIYLENKSHGPVMELWGRDFTHLIYNLSFEGGISLAMQNGLRSGLADAFFIAIYLYSYTFVLFFTPLLFMLRNDTRRMKRYTIIMFVNYAILIPFYVFFAVRTPGMYEGSAAQPILYSYDNFRQMIMEVDPLDNCFPSGHVSVPVSIVLMLLPMRKHRAYGRFIVFMMALSVLITISVLYLGIHWSIDVLGGILLALLAVWLSRKRWFVKRVERLGAPLFSALDRVWDGKFGKAEGGS